MMRSRIRMLSFGLAAVLAAGTLPVLAQAPGNVPRSSAKPARKAYNPARRVPAYFGKVGLSTDQKETIYAIRGKYQEKIASLQQQIDQMRAQELTECEEVLSEPQQHLLDQERPVSKRKNPKTAKSDD
ncbi:MAG: hypothetical protein ABI353_08095 [Isosphaeraceae bacterium]